MDGDGDGYGDTQYSTTACYEPGGYADNDEDCDDGDADVNPDATRICNDGIDNDCSGVETECSMALEDADTVFMGAAAGDKAGYGMASIGDINGDGYEELLLNATYAASTKGTAYLIYGPMSAMGPITLDANSTDAQSVGVIVGYYAAVTAAGGADWDGDGSDDFAIGAGSAASSAGQVWLYYGQVTGAMTYSDADAVISGANNFDYLGSAGGLARAGDINGDGSSDIILGASFADAGGYSNAGETYVAFGPIASGSQLDADSLDVIIQGDDQGQYLGATVAEGGDVDGDGTDDLLTASKYADSVFVFHGPVSGTLSIADADVELSGESAGDNAGASICGAFDHDNDGYADIVVGASHRDESATNTGAAYLLFGPLTSGTLGSSGVKISGVDAGSLLGTSVSAVDADLLLGSSGLNGDGEGGAFLLYGPLTDGSAIDISEADARLDGTDTDDAAGEQVSFTGALDKSGDPAILIGAPEADLGGADAGAVYLIFDFGQ